MRSRYIYSPQGDLIYAIERGVVTTDKREQNQQDSAMIMPDIQPYRSMIDGSVITSRSVHKEHLRQHGCVEIGNDSSIRNVKPKPLSSPPGLKETIIRTANEKLRRL